MFNKLLYPTFKINPFLSKLVFTRSLSSAIGSSTESFFGKHSSIKIPSNYWNQRSYDVLANNPPNNEDFFTGSEGQMFYRLWWKGNKPKPSNLRYITLIVHGYGEHSGRYSHLARTLAEDGALVCSMDHIGHGLSFGERGLISNFDNVVQDLGKCVEKARKLSSSNLPLFLIGHSMGGLLSSRFIQTFQNVQGVVYLGAVLGHWDYAVETLKLCPQDDLKYEDWIRIEIEKTTTDPKGSSNDPLTIKEYAEDPLINHEPYKVKALSQFRDNIHLITNPILFLHGSDDPFVPYQASAQAIIDMASKDKCMRIFPGFRHELINEIEIGKKEVFSEILSFFNRFL